MPKLSESDLNYAIARIKAERDRQQKLFGYTPELDAQRNHNDFTIFVAKYVQQALLAYCGHHAQIETEAERNLDKISALIVAFFGSKRDENTYLAIRDHASLEAYSMTTLKGGLSRVLAELAYLSNRCFEACADNNNYRVHMLFDQMAGLIAGYFALEHKTTATLGQIIDKVA